MNSTYKYISIVTAVLLTGCINIKLEDQFSDPDAITTVDTARELLASAYNSLPRYQLEFSVLSDDFVPSTLSSKSADMLNLYKWQEKAIEDLSDNVWADYYMTVAIVNALLPRVELIVPEDDDEALELNRIISEAKALKAMCYLDLIRLYAPVWDDANLQKDAIVLKDRLELDFLPRSPLKTCAGEVERLISEALTVENNDTEVFYLSTDAVKALQVEFLLWKSDWKGVIENGMPLLENATDRWSESSYDNLWSANESRDRIFAPYIFNTFYTSLCYDKSQGDYFVLDEGVLMDEGDVRKDWAEYELVMSSRNVTGLGKYNRMYYDNIDVRYINTLRYSGVCFDVAEAFARAGDNSRAIGLVNSLLSAYSAPLLPENLSGDELTNRILAEKRKEFAGEGLRLFDLKRLGKPLMRKTVFGNGTDKTIAADDYRWLFPIPQSEYKYNEYATQNPEWPYIRTE